MNKMKNKILCASFCTYIRLECFLALNKCYFIRGFRSKYEYEAVPLKMMMETM